ncbi:type 4a pilus biogenesis protein PilO [Radiobacillus kanasensis]|uniref:type 4a pilus biogenesis protein PilO n=1 Tax=Radiobacillus kanasensis TaxID=2844358 RepID=UPI001E4146A6|nr:type 4a pilus biogenesis protein PilO [Radiobacillus kanasensis]UFT97925.1 type 4a pilus biogenesis protein PilO [Radiobacillus kanasensis]
MKRNNKIILLSAFILLIGIGFYWLGHQWLVTPLKQEITTIEAGITEKESKTNPDKEEQHSSNNWETLTEKLPLDDQVDQLIDEWNAISKQTKVNIENIESTTINDDSELETTASTLPANTRSISYLLTISANSYANLNEFWQAIENMNRIMQVDQMDYSRQGDIGFASATLIVTAYSAEGYNTLNEID